MTSDSPVLVELHEISSDFLPLLGVQPERGRVWSEEQAARGDVAVLSYSVWLNNFGRDPQIVGRKITVSRAVYEVVGVMPPGFASPSIRAGSGIRLSPVASVWVPFVPQPVHRNFRGNRSLRVIGRLGEATLEQGRRELSGIANRLAQAYPDTNRDMSTRVVPLADGLAGNARTALMTLIVAACLLLLVACANVGGLVLARGSGRAPELAARIALGAGRARLIRQLLTENLVLALAGGAAGVALAAIALAALRDGFGLLDVPRLENASLNGRVLAAGLVVSLATGLGFGIVPALRLSATRTVLPFDARWSSGRQRSRQWLIGAQTALSLLLMMSAILLVVSFNRLTTRHGIPAPERTLSFQTTLSGTQWAREPMTRQFYDALLERLRRLPGVEAVGVTTWLLDVGDASATDARIDGEPAPVRGRDLLAGYTMADREYFGLAGLQLRQGRLFEERDRAGGPRVVVVNEAFVRAVVREGQPLGQRIRASSLSEAPLEIVGVVADANPVRVQEPERPRLYYPYTQSASVRFLTVMRLSSPDAVPVSAIRSVLNEFDRGLPLFAVETAEDVLSRASAGPRWGSTLVSGFAAIALLLGGVGVMGIVGYATARRTRECGIRLALGASGGSVRWLMTREALVPVVCGLIAGLAATSVTSRLLSAYLHEVDPFDPVLVSAAVALASSVSLLAAYVPARRAASVEPATALRAE
jgi:putative ABC transport system permease protein